MRNLLTEGRCRHDWIPEHRTRWNPVLPSYPFFHIDTAGIKEWFCISALLGASNEWRRYLLHHWLHSFGFVHGGHRRMKQLRDWYKDFYPFLLGRSRLYRNYGFSHTKGCEKPCEAECSAEKSCVALMNIHLLKTALDTLITKSKYLNEKKGESLCVWTR